MILQPFLFRILAIAPLLIVCAACADDTDKGDPVATWTEAFDTSSAGSLSGVWGSGPDDVFIVGGSEMGGEVYHFDGTDWAAMELPPDTPLLVWVTGFGPSEVYAVGLDGAFVAYDGDAWSTMDTGVEEDLWGIFGFDSSEVWIVGGDAGRGAEDREPVLLRFDGQEFDRVSIAEDENPRDATALFKIWGIDGRLFAVGQRGWVLEQSGNEWVQRSAGAEADQDFVSLWGTSADNIVFVGGRSNAKIATWDGTEIVTDSPPAMGGLNAVFMEEPGSAIVGGVGGFVGSFDVVSGEVVAEEAPSGPDAVHAIWGDGQGRTYAVGGSFLPPHRGLAWVRTVE